MFTDALTYPKRGPDATKTILIGGLLTLLSVLVVPILLVSGYAVRVIRSVAEGESRPPVFDRWSELLVDGAKGIVVMLAYFLVPAFLLGAIGAIVAGAFGNTFASGPIAFLVAAAIVLASVGLWYAATGAFVTFAVSGNLRSAFSPEAVVPLLRRSSFAVAWLVGLAVILVGGVVASIVSLIPVLGVILGAVVTFYAGIGAAYCYGTGFGAGTDATTSADRPAAEPVA